MFFNWRNQISLPNHGIHNIDSCLFFIKRIKCVFMSFGHVIMWFLPMSQRKVQLSIWQIESDLNNNKEKMTAYQLFCNEDLWKKKIWIQCFCKQIWLLCSQSLNKQYQILIRLFRMKESFFDKAIRVIWKETKMKYCVFLPASCCPISNHQKLKFSAFFRILSQRKIITRTRTLFVFFWWYFLWKDIRFN